jgi:hypothetical protein
MKPLVRWTIGDKNTSESFECLYQSISNFKKHYGDRFEYVICRNGSCDVSKFGIKCIDQNQLTNSLPYAPWLCAWKICPPRLHLQGHEIFIDNDLLIHQSWPFLETFLESKDLIFCTCALFRRYGSYDSDIPQEQKLNSGLFGLPPGFDLAQELHQNITGPFDRHRFDEQGLLARIFSKHHNFITVPFNDITTCGAEYKLGNYGTHFIGLNHGFIERWIHYKRTELGGNLL